MNIKIERSGSNWGHKVFKVETITDMVEGLKWMSKHGYKARKARINSNGNRVVEFKNFDRIGITYFIEFIGC